MKKILIVNLRRLGDVYSTAHLINSLRQSANVEISMLIYKESKKAAKNLAHVKEIFTIDREELITINSNKLFADTLSLNQLVDTLAPIKSNEWDTVINFSNDIVGAYLCSYLNSSTKEVIGVHFNVQRNVKTNSAWEIVFNDVLTTMKYSPIHFVDCYHRMLKIPVALTGNKLITSPENDEVASAGIANIRSSKHNGIPSKIVAIAPKASTETKSIERETLVRYIRLLNDSENIIPVLLIAPNDEERNYANSINESFGNNLIAIEADLNAAASVVKNVDLVVAADTVIKHVADLCGTPLIEISKGESPFLKQGATQVGNLILTDSLLVRNFKAQDATNTNITAEDIYASTIYMFSTTKNIKPRVSEGTTLYRTTRDNLGSTYLPIAGSVESLIEIQRLMSRQFISSLFDNSESDEIYDEVTKLGTNDVMNWCTAEKAEITNIMKDLLGTLRSLLQCIETKRSSRDFIVNLGKLMSHCEDESTSQIATIVFKAKIESINAKSFEENAKEVETLLYELKSYLQRNLNCIKNLEERMIINRKEEMVQRALQNNA